MVATSRFSRWYSDFASSVSVHGFAYTSGKGAWACLVWSLAISASVVLVGAYVGALWKDWQDSPVAHPFGGLKRPVTEVQVNYPRIPKYF